MENRNNRDRIGNMEALEPISFDFGQTGLSDKTKKLKPQVYRDGDAFCCIYGPDPVVGIFGSGETPLQAVKDWETDLEHRIERLTEGDHAAHHARQAFDIQHAVN